MTWAHLLNINLVLNTLFSHFLHHIVCFAGVYFVPSFRHGSKSLNRVLNVLFSHFPQPYCMLCRSLLRAFFPSWFQVAQPRPCPLLLFSPSYCIVPCFNYHDSKSCHFFHSYRAFLSHSREVHVIV